MSRKSRKKGLQLVLMIIAFGVVMTSAIFAISKFSSRAVEDPQALTVKWVQGDRSLTVSPYRVCDLFEKDSCTTTESNLFHVTLGEEETAELNVGKEIGSNKWGVARFFANDSVNSISQKEPGESVKEAIAGSTSVNGQRTPLGVVEVSTAVVGKNKDGEETTYGITWSIANDAAAKK